MIDGNSKKSKISWPKCLAKKWFNVKHKAEDFHADDINDGAFSGVVEEHRSNFSKRDDTFNIKMNKTGSVHTFDILFQSNNVGTETITNGSGFIGLTGFRIVKSFKGNKIDLDASQITDLHNYRIFVATWNVAGKSPPSYLNLEEWLHTSPPADIYVLGFQEIVPLNAGNVLGTEDDGPARKWLSLVRKTLNSLPGRNDSCCTPSSVLYPITELDYGLEGWNRENSSAFLHRCSFQSLSHSMRLVENGILMQDPRVDHRFSVCDNINYVHRQCDGYDPWDGFDDDENELVDFPCAHGHPPVPYGGSVSMDDEDRCSGKSRYRLVASKQMVGIFLTVWIKSDLKEAVQNLKVSCVGRGLMGYLGNKGSISISMSLHQTSFCFVCSHLTSGEKDGNEQRRNSDVMEILRKTRFPRVHSKEDDNTPQTILDHDRIIWLGDLNYRIALSYRSAKALVEMRNWRALLENDQLRMEQSQGRVFPGWNEGRIYFPPTYKYSNNSDRYAGENRHPREKRRTPAWCDRILWHGRGLQQLSYVRGESRFSDHRPVYSVFLAEVESINHGQIKKSTSHTSARIEVEELLPYTHGYEPYVQLSFI